MSFHPQSWNFSSVLQPGDSRRMLAPPPYLQSQSSNWPFMPSTVDSNQMQAIEARTAELENELFNFDAGETSVDEVFEDAVEGVSDHKANTVDPTSDHRPHEVYLPYNQVFGTVLNSQGMQMTGVGTQDVESFTGQQAYLNLDNNFHAGTDFAEPIRGETTAMEVGDEKGYREFQLSDVGEDFAENPQESSTFEQIFGHQEERQGDESDLEKFSRDTIEGARSGDDCKFVRGGTKKRRLSTPPPPAEIKSDDVAKVLKQEFSLGRREGRFEKDDIGMRDGPDVDRDRARTMNAHWKFHERVAQLIPRLPNYELFDWERRYWIAVLIEGKKPKNATSEKDFVWMKGNKFSTIATVFHSYANATMTDKDQLVLLRGSEALEMTDQMQQLDYFSDRLVVLRAALKSEPNSEGKPLDDGIQPTTVDLTIN